MRLQKLMTPAVISRHLRALALGIGALAALSLSASASAGPAPSRPGSIATVAGNGSQGDGGDGGLARSAQLNNPFGVAVDGAHNLYISNQGVFCVIRKVDAAGNITTVAGDPTQLGSYGGDGGPATAAQLNNPSGVATDKAGNLYIADTDNNLIRKVDVNGIITSVAGNGVPDPGLTGTGNSGYGGDGGPATAATMNHPTGVAVDGAGNIYIADNYNNVIREVSHATGKISTVAGNGVQGFSGDGGRATSASLWSPDSVAVSSTGNLYIADTGNARVRKVSAGRISTVAGNGGSVWLGGGNGGPARSAVLPSPVGVALDSAGNLYISDSSTARVLKVNSTGTISTVAGNGNGGYSGNGGPAARAQLNTPEDVTLDSAGNLYIADSANSVVREVAPPLPPKPVTPRPVSLSVKHTSKTLTVRVLVRNMTAANRRLIGLDVFAGRPAKHYAVHQNGPGLPYTVNPIPGRFAGQSTGHARVTFTTGMVTFTFALEAIGKPHALKLRAFQAGESAIGFHTRFYNISL
jgi:sugar lactone lactonase YvrE